MTTDPRILGKTILETILKNKKNINLIEGLLWKHSDEEAEKYKKILYNTTGIILESGVQEAYDYVKEESFNPFSCESYSNIVKLSKEEDDFMQNPISVEEGVNVCHKCGSKKTISYSKQTRAADEGTTVFVICIQCNNKWKM